MKKESLDYLFYKYSVLTLLMFIGALNYHYFINPAKIVAGGTNGLKVLLTNVLNLDSGLVVLIVSITTLLLAVLSKEYQLAISALYASIIYPFFVEITSNFPDIMVLDKNVDMMIIIIASAIITGVIGGLTCKLGVSQGGITLISQILYRKFKLSISKTNNIINATIILTGGYIFGASNVMYALVFLYVNKLVMDRIILGQSQKKMFYIITSEQEKVENYIKNELEAGCTIFKTKGGFLEKKRYVIMSTVSNRDYFKLKEGVHEIDKKAFMVITDSYQVKGGK